MYSIRIKDLKSFYSFKFCSGLCISKSIRIKFESMLILSNRYFILFISNSSIKKVMRLTFFQSFFNYIYFTSIVLSQDGDTDYFDIVAGVLQGDTLALYLFIICLDYVLRTSIDKIKENSCRRRLRRWHRASGKYTAWAETLLHSLERAAAGIGFHVNALKTEYKYFNQTVDISTLNGSSLKLVDKFTYLGSSVSSTEKDIDTWLTKA